MRQRYATVLYNSMLAGARKAQAAIPIEIGRGCMAHMHVPFFKKNNNSMLTALHERLHKRREKAGKVIDSPI